MGPDGESCSMPYAPVSALQRPQEPCTGATVRPGQRQLRGLSPNSVPARLTRGRLLPGQARQAHGLTTLLLGLVGAVPAVILAVTLPACRNAAAGVLAAEFIDPAGHLGCRTWARVRRVSSGETAKGRDVCPLG